MYSTNGELLRKRKAPFHIEQFVVIDHSIEKIIACLGDDGVIYFINFALEIVEKKDAGKNCDFVRIQVMKNKRCLQACDSDGSLYYFEYFVFSE